MPSQLDELIQLRMRSNAHSIDRHVAKRLRCLRKKRKLSQTKVADVLGLSFQQYQKFESGKNRIGAGRLFILAWLLGEDVAYFYEGCEELL